MSDPKLVIHVYVKIGFERDEQIRNVHMLLIMLLKTLKCVKHELSHKSTVISRIKNWYPFGVSAIFHQC